MSLFGRTWFAFIFFGILVLVSRYPDAPGQLFTFDDVNLAYSVGHFDVRISQPQPPGYPLFVLQMRVLHWLRFRRVESILLFLALAGSIAALVLLSQFGQRFFGGLAGFFAACVLVFHPVFWHSGITSALRVQLAIISVCVAWSCWKVWPSKDRPADSRWVLWSAIVLGLAAGIRPETGPLLFPLWAVSAWRAQTPRRDWLRALAAMAAAVLLWLVPAMLASGGPATYIRANLDYITDQASVSSGVFGAAPERWATTFWRLLVWTCCGVLSWTLPAVMAWKRREGWGLDRNRLAFLAVWLLPALVFALLVHLEDPGQSLAMAPPIALLGGYLFDRALRNWSLRVCRWETVILVAASLAVYWVVEFRDTTTVVLLVPLVALAAGLLMKTAQVPNAGYLPRLAAMAFLLAPLTVVQLGFFQNPGWYYKGGDAAGLAGTGRQVLNDMASGLALTSLSHIKNTLATDDHSLRQAIQLAAERPGRTMVVWEQGPVSWRKAAYYLHDVPIVVLDRKKIRSGAPAVIAIWKGPSLLHPPEGAGEQAFQAPAGGRVVWLLNPRTPFYGVAAKALPLTASGLVYFTDLPAERGSAILGDYKMEW